MNASAIKTLDGIFSFLILQTLDLLQMLTCGDVLGDMILKQLSLSSKVDMYFTKLM